MQASLSRFYWDFLETKLSSPAASLDGVAMLPVVLTILAGSATSASAATSEFSLTS
jgi:hypothetical protein